MKEVLIQEYNNTTKLNVSFKKENHSFKYHFLNGAFLEVLGPESKSYLVKFFDKLNYY